jgi:hypothetical protein
VRLYRESNPKPVIAQLARQLNVHPALGNWIRQDEADRGERDDRPTMEIVEALSRPNPLDATTDHNDVATHEARKHAAMRPVVASARS